MYIDKQEMKNLQRSHTGYFYTDLAKNRNVRS